MARRFRFRLETVEKLRKQERDEHRKVVADAVREMSRAQEQVASLTHQLYRTIDQSRDVQEVGRLDVGALCGHEFHRTWLHRKITEAYVELGKRQAELDGKRAKLAEAWKRLRVIERLREKQWARYRMQLGREEQAAGDEAAINGHLRQQGLRWNEVSI